MKTDTQELEALQSETLNQAKAALKNQDPEAAKALCDSLLDGDPSCAMAWHLRGISHAQTGDIAEAMNCFEKATENDAENSLYPYNLALALQKQGELDRAADAYQLAIDRKEEFMEARTNLGNVFVQQGKMLKAAACFEKLVDQFPQSSDAHFNLANTLSEVGRGDEAVKHYRQAISLDPSKTVARENLGRAYTDIGDVYEARSAWESWLEYDPENEFAKHMLAAARAEELANESGQLDLSSIQLPTRCTDECVRLQFNEDFASAFDEQLARLDYRTPALIQDAVASIDPPLVDINILDAGCGTGLCGPSLRPLARQLVGVDLAPAMLEEAHKREIYDEIIEAELTEFLQSRPAAFDLVVCSDTLCYFGDLTEFFEATAASLRNDGHLVFSVEKNLAEAPGGYRLQLHGRYCHTESYVRSALEAAGFSISKLTCEVQRNESGRPVEGFIVTAVRAQS
jgi:predicted TPR repeat methyltransferase